MRTQGLDPRYYVDAAGVYLGSFSGVRRTVIETDADGNPVETVVDTFPEVPAGAVEVDSAPADASDRWDGSRWQSPLAPRQADAAAAVNTHAARLLAAGFTYGGAVFQADTAAQINVMAVATGVAAGKGLPGRPDPWGWWDVENVVHPMTAAEFLTFAAALRDWTAAVKVTARIKKDAIEAAEDFDALEKYLVANPVDDGWP